MSGLDKVKLHIEKMIDTFEVIAVTSSPLTYTSIADDHIEVLKKVLVKIEEVKNA